MINRPFQYLTRHTRFYFSHFQMTWISRHFLSSPTLGVSKTKSFSGIFVVQFIYFTNFIMTIRKYTIIIDSGGTQAWYKTDQ